MAKRRFFKRSKARRSFPKMSRRTRKSVKSYMSPLMGAVMGAGYGAARDTVVNASSMVVNMIPAGEYKDEVFMALVSYAAAKFGKGMIKNIGVTGLTCEGYRIGTQLMNKTAPTSTSW